MAGEEREALTSKLFSGATVKSNAIRTSGFVWAYNTALTNQRSKDNWNVLIAFLIAEIATQGVFGTWSLVKATEQAGGAIDRVIESSISQSTVRKYHRLLEFSHIRDTIQPLLSFRNRKVKCDRDKVMDKPQVNFDLSKTGPVGLRLAKALGDAADAADALTECAKALAMETESEDLIRAPNGTNASVEAVGWRYNGGRISISIRKVDKPDD